jgi:hypothetical protein
MTFLRRKNDIFLGAKMIFLRAQNDHYLAQKSTFYVGATEDRRGLPRGIPRIPIWVCFGGLWNG